MKSILFISIFTLSQSLNSHALSVNEFYSELRTFKKATTSLFSANELRRLKITPQLFRSEMTSFEASALRLDSTKQRPHISTAFSSAALDILNPAALHFILCHEAGHYLARTNTVDQLATETEADYWIGSACIEKLLSHIDLKGYSFSKESTEAAHDLCKSLIENQKHYSDCIRVARIAESGIQFAHRVSTVDWYNNIPKLADIFSDRINKRYSGKMKKYSNAPCRMLLTISGYLGVQKPSCASVP